VGRVSRKGVVTDAERQGGAASVAIDVQLVAAARSGSAAAFDVLVDRYHAGIAGYLGRLLGERELAEDVTQDTFFAAYRALHRLSDEHTFSAWLYRIARNRAISAARRRAILRFVSLDALGERVSGWLGRGAAELEDVSTRQSIQAALDALPLGEREALLLHSLAGFTAREIAEILRISPDAAARRVSRASQRFRQHYRVHDAADAARDDPEGAGR
jgi:RNA polymerase sigma factor (sigma-70 family)